MTDAPTDAYLPALDLAAAIRRKEISPVEVLDSCLARIDELDPMLNAFCHRADDDARRYATEAADAVVRARAPEDLPPFHGVPLPIKDLVDVAGWPTTFGSAVGGRRATSSSPIVQRFLDAGFVLLGKTTTSEFGTVPFTESEALGISRNPWDPDRTPGGSSSGAGVAVAAGMAPIAHGGDGGGSIRIPASCTGLVGLKPTRGRVTDEVVDLEGLATHGVLTRTVADTAAALDVLARHDPAAWWSPPATAPGSFQQALAAGLPAGLRIGVLTGSPIEGVSVDPVCVAAVEATAAALEDAGSHLVDQPLTLPPAEELIGAFTTMWNVGGAGYEVDDPERVEPHNRVLREAARAVDAWSYAQAIREAQRLSRRIVEEFTNNVDLLLTPTMACLPPPIGAWRPGTDADPLMALVNSYPMAIFTSLFNVTGQPAISVPVAHDRGSDLPVGVQLVAAPWAEGLLLQVARLLEVTFPWAHRRPGAG